MAPLSKAQRSRKLKSQKMLEGRYGKKKQRLLQANTSDASGVTGEIQKATKRQDKEVMESLVTVPPIYFEDNGSTAENGQSSAAGGEHAPGPASDIPGQSSGIPGPSSGIPGPSSGIPGPSSDGAGPVADPKQATDLTTEAPAEYFPPDCAVRGCKSSSKSNPKLIFFPLPDNERRCAHWVRVIGRPELALQDVGTLHKEYKVCLKHFRRMHIGKFGLVEHAVPMLQIPTSISSVDPPKALADPKHLKKLRSQKPRKMYTKRTKTISTQTEAALEGVTCVSCARLLFGSTLKAAPPLTLTGRPLTPSKYRNAPVADALDEQEDEYEPPEEEPMIDATPSATAPQTSVFVYEYHPPQQPPAQGPMLLVQPLPEPVSSVPETVVVKMEEDDDVLAPSEFIG